MSRVRAAWRRLLVRDLAQLATPAGARRAAAGAPTSARVEVVEDAYVLCERRPHRGGRRACATSSRSTATSWSSTARGRCAVPGLVDCHTHACFARRPRRGVRAARRRRDLRGAARRRRRDPLDRPGDARGRRGRRSRARGRAASRLDAARRARRRSRRSRATGSTARPSSRRCGRSGPRAASRPGSARTPCRRSSRTPTRTSTSRSREVLPEAAQLAEAADVFLERGAFDVAQARRYLEACRDAGLALRLHGDQFTEPGAVAARDRARRAVGRPPRGDRARRASARSRRATSSASCCRRARSSSAARCRPRARSSTPARPSRSRPTSTRAARSARACRSSARSPARSCPLAGGGARRLHRQRRARARPRRPDRPARARLRAPTSSCSTRPTGATSPTTSAGDVVADGDPCVRVARRAEATLERMPTRKQRRRQAEGAAARVRRRLRRRRGQRGRGRPRRGRRRRATTAGTGSAGRSEPAEAGAAEASRSRRRQPPSWRRVRQARPDLRAADVPHGHRCSTATTCRLVQQLAQTVFLLVVFLPFSYLMDTVALPRCTSERQAPTTPQKR